MVNSWLLTRTRPIGASTSCIEEARTCHGHHSGRAEPACQRNGTDHAQALQVFLALLLAKRHVVIVVRLGQVPDPHVWVWICHDRLGLNTLLTRLLIDLLGMLSVLAWWRLTGLCSTSSLASLFLPLKLRPPNGRTSHGSNLDRFGH